ncbi:MAG: MotA/TolQ/ExbB proton channel family protein [Desulfatitalea sp.]|nr:MotA/TolQ/ExbB proton channel family protein [Desulfatitalea sp.]
MFEPIQTAFILLTEYLRTGGVVMLPLVAVSVLMWLLIAERVLYFRRLHRQNMTAPAAKACVRENRLPSPTQDRGIVALLVTEFIVRRSGRQALDRAILDETVQRISRSLSHRLAVIGVLAAMAPLLGLLGTVTGMIATFDVLAVFGTGNAKAMAGGISQALITTQTGLLVAIPGLYMKGFLERRARILGQRIASTGLYLKRQI